MAMTLRLTDEDSAALRAKAAEEGISMQEATVRAVRAYTGSRDAKVQAALQRILTEDAELLRRLAQ